MQIKHVPDYLSLSDFFQLKFPKKSGFCLSGFTGLFGPSVWWGDICKRGLLGWPLKKVAKLLGTSIEVYDESCLDIIKSIVGQYSKYNPTYPEITIEIHKGAEVV